MTTSPLVVLKTRFIPARTALPRSANSGPRWSIVGKSIARSTRSGTFVGPGICRKCRPGFRVMGLIGWTFLHSAYKMQTVQAIAPISRRPLHEEAVDRLRQMIVQGQLAPGQRLNERLLCEQLGISRTPLREAIKLLASEGLVALLPNRGAQVAPLEETRLAEALAVMGALEALAGELACRQASDKQIAEVAALHAEMLQKHARGDPANSCRHNQPMHLTTV